MNIRIIVALILVSINGAYSQTFVKYWQYVNEADYWFHKKEYHKSITLYKLAQKTHILSIRDYYILAKSYLRLNDKKKFFSNIEKMISLKRKGFYIDYLKKDIDLNHLLSIKDWSKIESMTKLIKSKSYVLPDSIWQAIDSLERKDQYFIKKSINSKKINNFVEFKSINDSLSKVHRLYLDYIKQYGYPNINVSGSDIYDIVLRHVDVSNTTFLEEIKVQYLNESMPPYYYGATVEYFEFRRMDKSTSCLYNTLKDYYLEPCEENTWDEIIKNRYNLGMSIFFEGPREKPIIPNKYCPWIDKIDLAEYMYFKK
jgi:hypothetical protein